MTLARLLPAAAAAALCAALISDLGHLDPLAQGLRPAVLEHLPQSGVLSPVTAILLNFRGYDTLLEVAVLCLAAWSVWTLPRGRDPVEAMRSGPPDPILRLLGSVLTPAAMLVGGYLLWVGAHAPGGAFQAGAVFSASAVFYLVSGSDLFRWRWPAPSRFLAERTLLSGGLAAFLISGVWGPLCGRNFLAFLPQRAGLWILFIESACAASIALILTALFAGRPLSFDQGEGEDAG